MSKAQRIRAVFFDIDGTLYRKETDILPDSVYEVMYGLKARNILPAIATGRSLAALPEKIRTLITQTNIELLVTINGQYNQYCGAPLSAYPIDHADLSDVITKLNAANIAYGLISDQQMMVSADTPMVRRALATIGHYKVCPNYHHEHPVYQMLIFCTKADEQFIYDTVLPMNYQTIRWHEESMDMLPVAGSKVRGIRTACDQLGIKLADVMAFGDGMNDLEMLQAVGIGIAMGDARPELHVVANDRTECLEDDGIIKALRRYGLLDSL